MLEQAKEDMLTIINTLNMDNIAESTERIHEYITLLKVIPNLMDSHHTPTKENKDNKFKENELVDYENSFIEDNVTTPGVQEKVTSINGFHEKLKNGLLSQIIDSDNTENNEDHIKKEQEIKSEPVQSRPIYQFQQKLKGGIIEKLEAYVPESAVRQLGLEHGDYVTAEEGHVEKDGTKKYFYQLAEKGKGSPPEGRIELRYGIIKKSGHCLIVQENAMGEEVRIGDAPFTFRLRENDIQEFNLTENDIVDVACYENNAEYTKVVWKYKIEDLPVPKEKQTQKSPDKKKGKKAYPQILKDKCVLVVGGGPKKSDFKTKIEEHGGSFLWAEGTEGKARLSSFVRKADVIVFIVTYISHRATEDTVFSAKFYRKPYNSADTMSPQSIVNIALDTLNNNIGVGAVATGTH